MPVVTSKQKAEEPGEIATGTPLNGNKFQKSLEAFRSHHEDCAKRRRNGLDHEIRVEAQRSEWLSRKLLDNLRQQQTLPGGRQESASRSQLSSCSDSDTMDVANIKQSPGSAPNKLLSALTSGLTESGNSTARQSQFQIGTGNLTQLNGHLTASLASMNGHANHHHSLENTNSNSNANSLPSVSVKTEPEDALPCIRSPPSSVGQIAASTANSGRHKTPPKVLPLPASSNPNGNGSGTHLPPKKKRRLSIKGSSDMLTPSSLKPGRSFSCSDDLEDDLKLSADDCIHGVISTPLSLIKPLEEGEDMVTTPSPPLSASAPKTDPPSSSSFSSSSSSSTSSSSSSQPPAASNSSFQNAVTGRTANYSLKQDLDDFTKVMAQVTEEEIAKERRKTHSSTQLLQNDPYRVSQPLNITAPAHLVSPPPYHTTATTARQQQPMASQPPGHYFSSSQPPQQHPIAPIPRCLSLTEASSYSIQSYHTPTAAHQYTQLPHMLSQVDPTSATNPTTFPPPPTLPQQQLLQRRSVEHVQKHPQLQHLSAISPQVQPPQQPMVMSPTVHNPLSTQHMPLFPDPTSHGNTTPTGTLNLPQTPTTPLEHFTSFTSQHHPRMDNPPLSSPTHPTLPFHSGVGSIPSSYSYGQKIAVDRTQTIVGSPTVTTAGMSWGPHGTLKETLLTQVGQKRPNQDAIGLGFPPTKISHTSTVIHSAAPNPNFQQQQYHPSSNYTGVNFSLPHTVAYQGHPTTFPYAPM